MDDHTIISIDFCKIDITETEKIKLNKVTSTVVICKDCSSFNVVSKILETFFERKKNLVIHKIPFKINTFTDEVTSNKKYGYIINAIKLTKGNGKNSLVMTFVKWNTIAKKVAAVFSFLILIIYSEAKRKGKAPAMFRVMLRSLRWMAKIRQNETIRRKLAKIM